MIQNRTIVALLLLVAVILLSAGCTQSPQGTVPSPTVTVTQLTPAPQQTTREELVSFVKDAVAYAKANGKERALAEFDKRNGSFFRGELYIYAYDFNGTTIAHPVNPEKIGVNRLGEKDANGDLFIKELRDVAQAGQGFVEYYYINPLHNNAEEKKLGYVEKVDDQWWLGSGIYLGTVEPQVSPAAGAPQTPEEIRAFVDDAAVFAQKSGRTAALAAFNDRNGPFVKGNVYIYALDYNGTALSLPFQPGMVGSDFSGIRDAAGQAFTMTEIALAKSGGGFLTFQYQNPAHNFTVEPKLSYVRAVDDTYWIGAGAYLTPDPAKDAAVKSLIASAKDFAARNGKERAIDEFNNRTGMFTKGDLYVFAYDYNGTVLAWPYQPDQIGVNRLDATDPLGKSHVREMVYVARNGGGTVQYFSKNPLRNNTTELKSSWIADIDGTWFIGAGTYVGQEAALPVPPSLSPLQ